MSSQTKVRAYRCKDAIICVDCAAARSGYRVLAQTNPVEATSGVCPFCRKPFSAEAWLRHYRPIQAELDKMINNLSA